jgi:predicted transcriptional regulator
MAVAATSLKLPRKLKTRIDRLARRSRESPHAFMLRALEGQVEAAERYQAFLKEGLRADEAMQRSGLGYAAEDVHRYLAARIGGRKVQRPKPVRWRG